MTVTELANKQSAKLSVANYENDLYIRKLCKYELCMEVIDVQKSFLCYRCIESTQITRSLRV